MELSSQWHLHDLNAIQTLFSCWIDSPREYISETFTVANRLLMFVPPAARGTRLYWFDSEGPDSGNADHGPGAGVGRSVVGGPASLSCGVGLFMGICCR